MNAFTFQCQIRWSDMDANGHVNNSVYSRYLEETRMNMFADLVPEDPEERLAANFVVSEQSMKFVRPLVYSTAPVTITARVTGMKAVSFSLDCEIHDAETTYIKASTLMVAFDSTAGRVRRMTDTERRSLERFMN
ncbi:acyl-CoA thioesterase [Streptomyces antarcticus]|uniref:acyl-CoA thioesterase n=1 Tax=Streptomyces antarcticus TaxID=2996458 RepID=UPI00226FD9D1|nr:thioesterase family protein [Streptomyces sp. H34-AA3]MCY0945373.1 thioesterase family protein [Streptomyces sp. H34-AA3]